MSPNDSSTDLELRIGALVERQVHKLRDEVMARVGETEAQLRELKGHLTGVEPAPVVPVAAETAMAADALVDLYEVVVSIDRAASQSEVLAALLEGVGRFASRSALFLTKPEGLGGWGSYGFEETAADMRHVMLEDGEGPWSAVHDSGGCLALDGEGCAALCRQLEAAAASEGLLAPFVLRDQTAAVLYADRLADAPPLATQAVQLLTHFAALAVEALATRQRSQTATLHVATVAAPEAAEIAPEPAAAETVEAAEPETTPAAYDEPVVAAEPAAIEAAEAGIAETEEISAVVELEAEAEAAPLEETAPSELLIPEVPDLAPDMASDLAPAAEPSATPLSDEELGAADFGAFELEESAAAEFELEDEELAPTEPLPAPSDEATQPLEAPPPEAPPLEVAPPPVEAVDYPTAVEPPPVAAPAEADAQLAEADAGSTEVQPPSDHEGPGWAFTAGRTADTGDDAQQEEARRLARLLVTEIKLYNEEQVEEGRRNNDIYARLKEDIDRSRQIFNERVDPNVREQSDYFHDEMVRILAGGNREALGV